MTPALIESVQVDDPSPWYVVQTNPQAEKKAEGELRRAGLRVYLPKRSYEVRNRRKHDTPTVRFRPLLIGYLFIRFPASMLDHYGVPQFGAIRDCQGVKGYVRAINRAGEWEPCSIADEHIADFMRRQRRREFGRPEVIKPRERLARLRQQFRKGDQVRITDGPFASFLATLVRLNDNLSVELEATIFDRPTKVTLEVGQFEVTRLAKTREAA